MFTASKRVLRIFLALFAVVILGISLDRGILNPALVKQPLLSAFVVTLVMLLLSLERVRKQLLKAIIAAIFETSERLFNTALFTVAIILYSFVSWRVFHATPHLDDSVAALFQAKIFAGGQLTIPLPKHPDFFVMTGMLDARYGLNHMASMYPPGYPAVFVPFLTLGIPWITNPILGGGLLVMINRLARELYRPQTGRLASALALFSPFIAVQSGTFLSHIPTAFALVLCMWSVLRLLKSARIVHGFLAGLGFGIAFLCRPLTALVIGVLIALIPLARWRRSIQCWKGVVTAGFMAVLAVVALASFQQATTGDYRVPGHELGLGDRGRMGFGHMEKTITHSPEVGWDHTRQRMTAMNHKVLGWPVPLFLIALLPFFLFRAGAKEIWLLLPSLALLLVYSTFWYYESFYEARYIFSGVPTLIILSARGYECLKERLGGAAHGATILLAGCMAFQLIVYFPQHLRSYRDNHGDVESVLPKVVRSHGITNAVIFMSGKGELPEGTHVSPRNDYYATGFMHNNITFDGDIVYARRIRRMNHRLAEQYSNRKYYSYVYDRPSNKAWLYEMHFDGSKEHRSLVEPTEDESTYMIGQLPTSQLRQ